MSEHPKLAFGLGRKKLKYRRTPKQSMGIGDLEKELPCEDPCLLAGRGLGRQNTAPQWTLAVWALGEPSQTDGGLWLSFKFATANLARFAWKQLIDYIACLPLRAPLVDQVRLTYPDPKIKVITKTGTLNLVYSRWCVFLGLGQKIATVFFF